MKRLDKPTAVFKPQATIVRPTLQESVGGQPLVDDVPVFRIHRYQKRTLPCLGPSCFFCAFNVTTEERIFLPVFNGKVRKPQIIDLPVSLFEPIVGDALAAGVNIRELIYVFERTKRWNGPIEFRSSRRKADRPQPKPIDLARSLMATWASNVAFAKNEISAGKIGAPDCPVLDDRD